MTNEAVHLVQSEVVDNLNLEQSYEQILIYQNAIRHRKKIIYFCVFTMVVSTVVSIFSAANEINDSKEKKSATAEYKLNISDHIKSLATSGNEYALIWLGLNGFATQFEFQKLKSLAQITSNPEIIDALIKTDSDLKIASKDFKGLSDNEIIQFSKKGIRLGSIDLIEEQQIGALN